MTRLRAGNLITYKKEVIQTRGWAVKKAGADRASSVTSTQREAEQQAKDIVGNLGGGEVRIQGRNGQWRDSDTVPSGNDPYPPKDTKH